MKKIKKDKENLFEKISKDRILRQAVARESHFMFFHLYFAHYVKFAIAEFQKEIFRITEDATNKLACIVAFRNSAKSTIVTLSYSLWSILGIQQKKFVIIFCQTQAQAKNHMANIRSELESNLLLKSDLGPFREENGEWGMSSLVFTNTGARITVGSLDQSIRGIRHLQYRPDLIILDDIEDLNSTRTLESRDKTFDWFTREIIPLGDTATRVLIVSNLLHEDCLVMRLKEKIENKEIQGIFKMFPLLDDTGNCLWPGKFKTPEDTEILRKKVANDLAWQQEYLLNIVYDTSKVIHPEWIKSYSKLPDKTEENEYRGALLGIDLALSEKNYADCTAMVAIQVFHFGEDMEIYIEPNPVNEKLDFLSSIERAKFLSISLSYEGRPAMMYAENNSFQDSYVQTMKILGKMAMEGVHSIGDKRSRLALVSPLLKRGKVFFHTEDKSELVPQLIGFGIEKHDDLADAFSLVLGEAMKRNRNKISWPKISDEPDTICGDLMDMIF